jgi:hypothetical protein
MNSEIEKKPVDLNRRRLAKSGVAVPIVLASLASKNALASPAYRCTISGQLSNNYSPVPTDGTNRLSSTSCDLGSDVAELKNNIGWGSVIKTTLFATIFSGANSNVYFVNNNKLVNSAVIGGTQATLDQVLKLANNTSTPPPDVTLGRAAITAYVAWANHGADYPLNVQQIRDMFDYGIRGNVNYPFASSRGTVNLNRTEILQYFRFLIGGAAPTLTA